MTDSQSGKPVKTGCVINNLNHALKRVAIEKYGYWEIWLLGNMVIGK
jgi:hypothetical protein